MDGTDARAKPPHVHRSTVVADKRVACDTVVHRCGVSPKNDVVVRRGPGQFGNRLRGDGIRILEFERNGGASRPDHGRQVRGAGIRGDAERHGVVARQCRHPGACGHALDGAHTRAEPPHVHRSTVVGDEGVAGDAVVHGCGVSTENDIVVCGRATQFRNRLRGNGICILDVDGNGSVSDAHRGRQVRCASCRHDTKRHGVVVCQRGHRRAPRHGDDGTGACTQPPHVYPGNVRG